MKLLRAPLSGVRLAVSESPELSNIDEGQLGVKVWLLPNWYLRDREQDHRMRVAAIDFTARYFDLPTMVCAGEISNESSTSSLRRWAIGKGLIGMAVFGPESESFFSTVHSNLQQHSRLAWREFRRLPYEDRLNRRRRDMRALERSYATAVAVGIRQSLTSQAFGCITLDTPSGVELTRIQIEACGDILVSTVPQLLQVIVNEGDYQVQFS